MNGVRATELASRAEDLLRQVEEIPAPAAREAALALVRAVLELYGQALARLTAMASDAAETGEGRAGLTARLVDDELVAHLLLLHGLHPLDASARIARALAAVRPRLGGAQPDLVGVDGPVARLRLAGGSGCRSTAAAAVEVVREAVRTAAPEIEHVQVDQPAPAPVLVPLERVRGPR